MISACRSVQKQVYDYMYVQSALPEILVEGGLGFPRFRNNLEAFNARGKGSVHCENARPPAVAQHFGAPEEIFLLVVNSSRNGK